jgi:acyl dehydratase
VDLQRAQGRVFEPCAFTVGDRLSVPAYARAVGIDDPLLCSVRAARSAGLAGRLVVPPMFAFFQTLDPERLTDELGFVWGQTLSAGMEFVAGPPITDDDEVVGQTRVEAVWERTGRDGTVRQFLRLATEYRTAGGEFVCWWRIVFIEKKDGDVDPDLPPAPSGESPTGLEEIGAARRVSPAPKAVPGETLPSHSPPALDRFVLARMSVAIDNPDPLHLDDDLARQAGLPGVVGQGSLVAGALYEPVRRWAGIDRVVAGSVTQRRPVLLGAALRADGHVETVETSGPTDLAICRTVLVDQSGEAVAEATFRVVL